MATRTRAPDLPDPRAVAIGLRGSLLILCTSLAFAGEDRAGDLSWVLALLVTGVLASLTPLRSDRAWLAPLTEGLVTATGIVVTGGAGSPLLPYLLAPTLVAGLTLGVPTVLAVVAASGVLLALGTVEQPDRANSAAVTGGWALLSLAAGLVAGWVRRVLRLAGTPDEAVRSAHRLLAQLRSVVRTLPGGLDPGTVAVSLLEQLRTVSTAGGCPSPGGTVLVATGERLVALADTGQPPGEPEATDPRVRHALTGSAVRLGDDLVLPLRVGAGVVGLAVLAPGPVPWPGALVDALLEEADDQALRLETALLFDDVRGVAISEERHRLAREIHDGIAQDLVVLGYGLDASLQTLPAGSEATEGLRELRGHVTRVVSDLRMSLYDLRSEVDRQGGLGQALGEYVRTVGASSGLVVHLSLDEGARRLSPEVEAELLRIAQEAITDARKHARPANLWVTCEVEPPRARLVVADDGRGDRSRSGARAIIAERTGRLRGTLSVSPRSPEGTVLEVVLGDVPEEVAGA